MYVPGRYGTYPTGTRSGSERFLGIPLLDAPSSLGTGRRSALHSGQNALALAHSGSSGTRAWETATPQLVQAVK